MKIHQQRWDWFIQDVIKAEIGLVTSCKTFMLDCFQVGMMFVSSVDENKRLVHRCITIHHCVNFGLQKMGCGNAKMQQLLADLFQEWL